ncbi:MAG: two-component sensor histidine kinase [Hamadaea sp.]|nr:two-component sensor histidine kinase [Hamadaea sp.]
MRTLLATLGRALRRPSLHDGGLAAALLVGTWATHGLVAVSAPFLVATGLCVAAVAVRGTWPIPALAAAVLGTGAQMSVAAAPTLAALAVPLILYTIAAHRPPKLSLALLGAALVAAAAWSAYVAYDGTSDGWLADGRSVGSGGEVRRPDSPIVSPALNEPDRREAFVAGPTAWGGILVLGSPMIVAWAVGWGVRSRRAYLEELRARARDLERDRDRQAALAAAAERARLARELHDVVAHGLAVIVMQAQGGAAAFAKRPADTLAALDTIVATGRASLADIRHVLSASEPADDPARPLPGLAHLPRLLERVRQAGTSVELRVDGASRPLPVSVDISAYRIVQEALTNTMKHAGPGARAQIVLSYGTDELSIDVSDDGTDARVPDGTGNGLRGMAERAALLGGAVTAGPGRDGGYAVRARLPVAPREETA